MRPTRILILLFLFVGASASAQIPSPEKFINAVFPKVIDSVTPHYFLLLGADSGRFVRFDYDEWADHHLLEPVPIGILNELAEKVYLARYTYRWRQDSLTQAVCVTRRQADSILYLNPPEGNGNPNHFVFSFSLPQFTDDGKYAVIDLNLVCGGRCGVGTTYLFHHYSSGWKVVGEFTNWEQFAAPHGRTH